MITPLQKEQLCKLILEISKHEKKMEAIRQLICEYPEFAPYTVFTRIDTRQVNTLSPYDFNHFSISNKYILNLTICQLFIELHAYNRDLELSFHEYNLFLDAVLPQDNPQLRYETLQRESRALLPGERISDEIEYTLIKLIDWETQGEMNIKQLKCSFLSSNGQTPIGFLTDCFYAINTSQNGLLTKSDISLFFRNNQQEILSDEINGFFRRANQLNSQPNLSDSLALEHFLFSLDVSSNNYLRTKSSASQQQYTNGIKDEPTVLQSSFSFDSFGDQPTNRSRIFSHDQTSLASMSFTPKKYNKGGMAYEIPTNATKSTTEKIRSFSNSFSTSQKEQPTLNRNTNYVSGYEKARQEIDEQILIKSSELNSNSKEQLSNSLQSRYFNFIQNKSNKRNHSSQRQSSKISKPCRPMTSNSKSPLQQSNSKISVSSFRAIGGNNDSGKKQTLLQFKQDIRGQLAMNKTGYQRSQSPQKHSQRSKQLSQLLNTSNDKNKSKQQQHSNSKKVHQNAVLTKELRQQVNQEDSFQRLSRSFLQLDTQITPQKNRKENKLNRSQKKTNPIIESSYGKIILDAHHIDLSKKKKQLQKTNTIASQKKQVPRSSIHHLIQEYLLAVIRCSQKLEKSKQKLIEMSDFNLFDAFKLIDKSEAGIITAKNIQHFLNEQNIAVSINEIIYFIKKFDALQNGTIRFSNLREAILPRQEPYQRIIDNREESGIAQAFCQDTIQLFARLIIEHISVEYQLEVIKQSISKEQSWDFEEAFYVLNQSATGFINLIEIQQFLLTEGVMVSQQEASDVIIRFDRDKDSNISLIDFVTELRPSSFI